jgi:hypothetical protein
MKRTTRQRSGATPGAHPQLWMRLGGGVQLEAKKGIGGGEGSHRSPRRVP